MNEAKRPFPFLKKRSGLQKFIGKPISNQKTTLGKEQDKGMSVPPSTNLKSRRSIVCKNVANNASQKQRLQLIALGLPELSSVPNTDFFTSDLSFLRKRKIELEKQLQSCDQSLKGFKSNAPSAEFFKRSSSSDNFDDTIHPHTVETAPLIASIVNNSEPPSSLVEIQILLKERMDRAIQIYETKNAAISQQQKCREDELRIIWKDIEDFQKFKQVELDKLNKKIAEKRQELRRERQQSEQLQKQKFGLPYRKEREELTKLKQKVKSAQEELKKMKMGKINFKNGRLRNCLVASKKETENLRIRLAGKENELANRNNQNHVDQQSIPNRKMKGRPPLVEIKPTPKNFYNYQQNNKVEVEHDKESTEVKVKSKFTPLKEGTFVKCTNFSKDIDEPKHHVQVILEPEVLKFGAEGHSSNYKEIQHGDEEEMTGRSSLAEKSALKNSYNHHWNNNVEVEHDEESTEVKSKFTPLKGGVFCTNFSKYTDEPKHPGQVILEPKVLKFSAEGRSSNYKEIQHGDSVEHIYSNGKRLVLFQSGNRKFISQNGRHVKYEYVNGDIQEIFPDRYEVYTHSSGLVEKFYADGLLITEFPNGQVEMHYRDGSREIIDNCGKLITKFSNGNEETLTPDGIKTTCYPDGTVIAEFPSGAKEMHTADLVRSKFMDGVIETVYKTGCCETRFVNRRCRIKDEKGNVLFDNSRRTQY